VDDGSVTLRRWRGGWVIDPPGWQIDGVIGPVVGARWGRAFMLFCSRAGLVLVRRSSRGFWAAAVLAGFGLPPTFAPDHLLTAQLETTSFETSYGRGQIATVCLRRRRLKNEVRLLLKDGTRASFFILARAATEDYRRLLRALYDGMYEEEGFRGWWDMR
jgi:hypothetical protein